jgi:glycine oxidase
MSDCLIVGGGVIGLSLAYELAGQGLNVRVIDSGQPGQQASWAGAGIFPPASMFHDEALHELAELSNRLHGNWAEELKELTGIDNGFCRCGAIYLERDPAAARQLDQVVLQARRRGVTAHSLTARAISEHEPELQPPGPVESAYLVEDECQLRNPRHLKALVAGCLSRGVDIVSGAAAEDFEIRGDRVRAVRTSLGSFAAKSICITTGSWSTVLIARLGAAPMIKPIRGQMVLLASACRFLQRIVNEGSRYLVPRDDGRVLVGSTEEDAGFDRSTTAGAIADLLAFALGLVPRLREARMEQSWAGLRPATSDGLPYLGRVPGLKNAFVAAGHFRGGLQLSTGTAVVMSQLIRGQKPLIDLSPFGLQRDTVDYEQSAANGSRRRPLRQPLGRDA